MPKGIYTRDVRQAVCQHCTKVFEARQRRTKFCSDNCITSHHREQAKVHYDRVCANPECRVEFETTDQRKKYCSLECCRKVNFEANRHKYTYEARMTGKGYVYKREWSTESHAKVRQEIIDILGGKCEECGFTDLRALQVDHRNGDGALERKVGVISLASRIRSNPSQYAVLCANCNWIKRIEKRECRQRLSLSNTAHSQRKYYDNSKAEAYHVLGDSCKECGISDTRCLQIDHLHGDGHMERKVGRSQYLKVIERPGDHQLLCANCNWIKRAENKEYRGRPRKYAIA